ncbi:MAG: two-component system sensor histidine kinase CreC [Gammaproteobacteria bacterium]|nr:two-component system sensor histidine kinase CreC [Gammaproteobacteria bacterium]NNC97927.1 two-component system sensor histidine kinase CreC [Gammaproteobacteria bacterium]
MKLSVRIFLAYFLLVAIGAYWLLNSVVDELQPSMSQSAEHALVDTANLLAEVVARDLDNGALTTVAFSNALQRYRARELNAEIYLHDKKSPDFQVYITDNAGKVVFHTNPEELGKDYSNWRDVARTLRGEYGARTSRSDIDDPLSTVMYVAAPIKWGSEIHGVLTVGKPNVSFQPVIELNKNKIWRQGVILLVLGLILGLVTAFILTRSIRKLIQYVEAVRKGERVKAPVLREKGLDTLATAVEAMREELEGKSYVENYIHTLTHEMKSPLATIQGASELLQEENMDSIQQQRFLGNIQHETDRLRQFIDRLLKLASVEKRQFLESVEPINLQQLIATEIESKTSLLQAKDLNINFSPLSKNVAVHGERFLLQQALSNLLDNAIDFASSETCIQLRMTINKDLLSVQIENIGETIPDYAKPRLFERFYSLPRKDGKKSTGLGLSFVKEVASLHGGSIDLKNSGKGVVATFTLPCH